MLRTILVILVVMLVAAVVGVDCLTCGQGQNIRSNIKSLFQK